MRARLSIPDREDWSQWIGLCRLSLCDPENLRIEEPILAQVLISNVAGMVMVQRSSRGRWPWQPALTPLLPGYYSFRNINEGSWFINDLCKVLKEYAHKEDVNTMMTRVNRNVALGRVVASEYGYRRQMPCHVNMLTSALYLCNVRQSQI